MAVGDAAHTARQRPGKADGRATGTWLGQGDRTVAEQSRRQGKDNRLSCSLGRGHPMPRCQSEPGQLCLWFGFLLMQAEGDGGPSVWVPATHPGYQDGVPAVVAIWGMTQQTDQPLSVALTFKQHGL